MGLDVSRRSGELVWLCPLASDGWLRVSPSKQLQVTLTLLEEHIVRSRIREVWGDLCRARPHRV